MALTKNQTPEFDSGDGEGVETNLTPAQRMKAEAEARAATNAEKAPPKTETPVSDSRAVAPAANTQVAVSAPMVNPFEPLKDAFPVEYDTFLNIQLNQGNAINKDTNASLGSEIGLELMTFQDQTVVSAGVEGDEGKELVRYSDDGITTSKGENVTEYLKLLKEAGHEKANISKRLVIAGPLFDAGVKGNKIPGLRDKLVQINLPPSSVSTFKRYMADQAFQIAKRGKPVAGVERMRITMDTKTKGQLTWTIANFSRYDDPVEG